ncbi:MAG: signal recognition particle-docking protein FtsY [candidate division TM6 bacterium GW2011_GWF2_37_49]|nr:MAG: signal recognition particle-docking protein FtsY [candidate division TM6 bacterium GW2011_GWF2_37_49]
MFGFIKDKIKKIYNVFTQQVSSIFSRQSLDEQFLHELSVLLISADTGVETTNKIIDRLRVDIKDAKIKTMDEVKIELERLLLVQLSTNATNHAPRVLMMVGVNGSGKTTFCAKYANLLKSDGKKVILVAGDTFRAAATQQLTEWANRIDIPVFLGKENQDPASVIFDACKKFKDENFDHIIIDTAGRLQTKVNLMKELEKIRKIIERQIPGEDISTWLTIDSMLGQNSLRQAEVFEQSVKLNGTVLTKLDGTGKGGIVFAVVQKLQIPILYTTYGEQLQDLKRFDDVEYVKGLLYE